MDIEKPMAVTIPIGEVEQMAREIRELRTRVTDLLRTSTAQQEEIRALRAEAAARPVEFRALCHLTALLEAELRRARPIVELVRGAACCDGEDARRSPDSVALVEAYDEERARQGAVG